MVALGLVEVGIVPDEGDFEEYGKLIGDHHCGWYKATVNPFPVFPHPDGDSPKGLVKYIEVTEGAYYQFDLVLNNGLDFGDCDALIYELFVDGKRKEGIVADQKTYEDDNDVGPRRWAACFGGVRTGTDNSLKINRLRFNQLRKPQTQGKRQTKKSEAGAIRVEVRRYKMGRQAPRRKSVPVDRSRGRSSGNTDQQPISMAGENYIGTYAGKDPLVATFIFKYGTREYLRSLGVIADSGSESVAGTVHLRGTETSTVQRQSALRRTSTESASTDQEEDETVGSLSRGSEIRNKDSAQLPEFQCSACGQWKDVRDRPKHHRSHGVPPPPLHTEARRASQRDADDNRRTRSHFESQTRTLSLLPVRQAPTSSTNTRSRQSNSASVANVEFGLGNDDNTQHYDDEESQISTTNRMASSASQTASRTSVSRLSRSKRHRSSSRLDHRPQKAGRVGSIGHPADSDLPSDADEVDDNGVERLRTDHEEVFRRARAAKRRASTADLRSMSETEDDGLEPDEPVDAIAVAIAALRQGGINGQVGAEEARDSTSRQQQDNDLGNAGGSIAADEWAPNSQPQPRGSMSIKSEEEKKILRPGSLDQADERLRHGKQAFILKYLNKLKSGLCAPEAGEHSELHLWEDRTRKINTMKREFKALIDDDFDDEDEIDSEQKQIKQRYIQEVLHAFEQEIVGGGTGLWRRDSSLKVVRILKREYQNLLRDERERSGGMSFRGSVVGSEVISLLDEDSD